MRPRRLRTWAWLAAAIVVMAVAVGGGGRAQRGLVDLARTAGVARQSASAGAPDAMLRTEADRVERDFARTPRSGSRLLLLFAVPLAGLGLLLSARPRPARTRGGPPSLARVRAWVGMRAPPSPSFVTLTS